MIKGLGGIDNLFFGTGAANSGNVSTISYTTSQDISSNGGTAPGDIYATNIIISGAGTVVTCYGGRLFAREKITIGAGATLSANGFDAVGGTPGGAPSPGTLGVGRGGGVGGVGAVGTAGIDFSGINWKGLGTVGGSGGSSSDHAGGTGGALLNSLFLGQQWGLPALLTGWVNSLGTVYQLGGGSGGGGGGGQAGIPPQTGGAGGGGGSVIMLAAPVIEIDGSLLANGGAGGNAPTGGSLTAGGGGGGGAGLIILMYSQLIHTGTVQVNGGVGGTGINGGSSGGTAPQGIIIHLNGLSTQLGPITNSL